MAILNYTTKVSIENTIGVIQKCLVSHGAKKIVVDYEDAIPVAVTFALDMEGRLIAFSLPANYNGVLKAMRRDKKVGPRYCNEEQARRVSWRIVKDWVEAQMAFVESDLADMAEVFLPYAVYKGTTLYKSIKSDGMLLLTE